MPFKGDMRLGGARRNDSTMNGFSAGPDFPAAGIVVGFQEGIQRTDLYGGNQISYYYGGETYYSWAEIFDVNIVTDGNGGEVPDYSNYLNLRLQSEGTVVATSLGYQTSYITLPDGNQYSNGDLIVEIRHDGMGNLGQYTAPYSWASAGSYITTLTEPITAVEPSSGSVFQVGTRYVDYTHDGYGGYLTSESPNTYYYPSGTTVGSVSLSALVNLDGYGEYQLGTHEYDVQSDGYGGAITGGINSTSWYSYGTFITNLYDNDYFSDGNGWYFTSYTGGGGGGGECPTYGTNIASGSGTYETYISELNTTVSNGTYEYVDYADGNCGVAWSDSTVNALPYGTVLAEGPYEFDQTGYISEIDYQFNTGKYYVTAYLSDQTGYYYPEFGYLTGSHSPQGSTITSDFVAETFYAYETGETYNTGLESASYNFQHDGTGWYQNGPLSQGERYASGTPVISGNTGSHAYYAGPDGWDLYLFHDGIGGYYTSTL